MVRQFKLPRYIIWLFAGAVFLIVGLISVFEWTYGLLTLILALGVAYAGYWFFFRPAFTELEILKRGEPATAVILKSWDTGISVDHHPRIGLLLEIRHSSRVPYQVEMKHNIRKENLKFFQAGRTLEVRVDPRDPRKIAISAA